MWTLYLRRKPMIKKICVIITLIMLITSMQVFAIDTYGGYTVPVDIDINGSFVKCAQKPILINGTTYIPLRAFADAVGGTIEWDGERNVATMVKSNHTFEFYLGKEYSVIDGSKVDYPSVDYNDLTFVPVRAVSETLGYKVEWDDFYLTVKITAPDVEVAEGSKDKLYTYEDMMYLGKITHVESGYQHFKVKLGVAATVVNRVKSKEFPSTIKDVIFDTRYSVQFPPAHTSKFDNNPSKESMIAAKCVLNGVNLVGNSLYFVDTPYASGSWVGNNRPHYITIYDMSFYE